MRIGVISDTHNYLDPLIPRLFAGVDHILHGGDIGQPAILLALERAVSPVSIFNLGTDEYCQVNQSIQWICERLGLSPSLHYSGGDRGWIGDNPFIFLDCSRIRALGWRPRLTIQQAVVRTVDYLQSNREILAAR